MFSFATQAHVEGLSARDVLDAVEVAIGGKNVSVTIEGRERYPIQVRLERGERDDIEVLLHRANIADDFRLLKYAFDLCIG